VNLSFSFIFIAFPLSLCIFCYSFSLSHYHSCSKFCHLCIEKIEKEKRKTLHFSHLFTILNDVSFYFTLLQSCSLIGFSKKEEKLIFVKGSILCRVWMCFVFVISLCCCLALCFGAKNTLNELVLVYLINLIEFKLSLNPLRNKWTEKECMAWSSNWARVHRQI
jgi:predicted CDP-diglyceride synthetase/phosphatidate cytidylyltransferase